jgi:diadenosine tetraphosphate (Ap4A) HIT family hydrolase
MSVEKCVFCDTDNLEWRIIRSEELCYSVVSVPQFRPGHVLVVPRKGPDDARHATTRAEVGYHQGAQMYREVGRLQLLLDQGYGHGTMQKFQPTQRDNHVKQSHLHEHVFPRQPDEQMLFPVPEPNTLDFDGFYVPTNEEVMMLAESLR